jgi:tRNA A-37 threonylcarbamoyl transferase component Bud32
MIARLGKRRRDEPPGLVVPGFVDLVPIGRGGFSTVYGARQVAVARTVALKVLHPDLVGKDDLRHFTQEVQAIGRLTGHPHVVTIFDADVTRDGRPYIVMEFCERGSLAAQLGTTGPSSLADALAGGVKLCGALAAAHAAGILHGDVKPQNVLVNRFGQPALADFGLASFSRNGVLAGMADAFTLAHAPPEVLERQVVTAASDLYALASTIYTVLAGRTPHPVERGMPVAQHLLRVLRDPVADIHRGDVPATVSNVLRDAMAIDPAHRPSSAMELGRVLQQLKAELGLPATDLVAAAGVAGPAQGTVAPEPEVTVARVRRSSVPEPAPRPVMDRSRRRLALAAAGLAAVVAAGAVLLTSTGRGGDDPAKPGPREVTTTASAGPRPDPRPKALSVSDQGASAVLRWRLADARFPLVLLRRPGPHQPVVLAEGSTGTVVGGLDPRTGYCFQVGAVVELGRVAWSAPACIRGAQPSPSPG